MVTPSLISLVCIACVGSSPHPSLSLPAPEVTETDAGSFPPLLCQMWEFGAGCHCCPLCLSRQEEAMPAGKVAGAGLEQSYAGSALLAAARPWCFQWYMDLLPETLCKHTVRELSPLRCEVMCEGGKWGWTCFREMFLDAMDNWTDLTIQGFSPCLFFDQLWPGHFRGLLFIFELSKDHESTEQNRHKITCICLT